MSYWPNLVKKTKKEFPCAWCGTAIEVGSTCLRVDEKLSDSYNTYRLHLECNEAADQCECWQSTGSITAGQHERGKTCEKGALALKKTRQPCEFVEKMGGWHCSTCRRFIEGFDRPSSCPE